MDIESILSLEKYRLAQEYKRLQHLNDFPINSNRTNSDNDNVESKGKPVHKMNKENIKKCLSNKVALEHDKNCIDGLGNGTKKDDMEQWVSDTFYSYFPGYNDEVNKRQISLQRQHFTSIENYGEPQKLNGEKGNKNPDLSSSSSQSSNVIRKGPPVRSPVRPESARYKLLQDLRHTDLNDIINCSKEDMAELKRRKAELALAKKREYQNKLLQQIEEKRQLIRLLKENEEKQDKALTKRLEKHLKTIKMEEQSQKESPHSEKINDLLLKLRENSKFAQPGFSDMISDNAAQDSSANKVYKYFSSYPKQEHVLNRNRSWSSLSEMELCELTKTEKECFHLSEHICPMCNGPLKEFQNFCLHCQKKLLLRLKSSPAPPNNGDIPAAVDGTNDVKDVKDAKNHDNGNIQSFNVSLVCCNCNRVYTFCSTCSRKGDICRACQRKRNVCMQCRRDLCSFCLEEIACGKDVEQTHINEQGTNAAIVNDSSTNQIICGSGEGVTNDSPSLGATNKVSNSAQDFRQLAKEYSAVELNDSHKIAEDYGNEESAMERMHRDIENRLLLFFRHYGDLVQANGNIPTLASQRMIIKRKYSLSTPLLREMPKLTRQEINKLQEN